MPRPRNPLDHVGYQSYLQGVNIVRVGGKFRLKERIGSGSFGIVYLGINIISKAEVAIKFEPADVQLSQLQHEFEVYQSLVGDGIPSVQWFGTEGDYNALVLTRLGPSLEDLFNYCNRKFSLKTVLLLADQMISRIEHVHSSHFIHRDIKPANFLIGTGLSCNQAYIIDFGLAKRYRDPRTHLHIPFRADHHILTGTTSFASLNSHLGIEQSRRDDLESLAYILIYFLRGSLPWYNAKSSTHNQRNKIRQMKVDAIPNLLVGLPNEFSVFLHYTRALGFEGKPDYTYMRKLFHDLRIREGHEDDDIFDWCLPMMSPDDQTHNNHMMIDGKPLSKKPDTVVGSSKRVLRSNSRRQHSLVSSVL